MAELHQARRPAQLEHLHEQVAQRLEMSPPEVRDGAEIRPCAIRRDE
jgi:hypothetical protein